MNFGTSIEDCLLDVTWTGSDAPKSLPIILTAQLTICTLVTAQLMACGMAPVPKCQAGQEGPGQRCFSQGVSMWGIVRGQECEAEMGAHSKAGSQLQKQR